MSGIQHFSIDLADSDTLEAFYAEQTNTDTQFLQLSTGAAVLTAQSLDLQGIRLLRVSGTGQHLWHDRMLSSEWRFAVLTNADGDATMGRTELAPTTGHLLRPGEEAPLRINGSYTTLELTFSEMLPKHMGWDCMPGNLAKLDEDVSRALLQTANMAFASTDCRAGNPAATSSWRNVFLDLLDLALMPWRVDPKSRKTTMRHSTHSDLVHTARKLLLDRDAEHVVDVETLASSVGVSRRRVFQVFKSELGIGPRRFREVVRLNALRNHLLRETPESNSVTLLANDYGFSELGRLAGTYRKTFGELPSETLKRSYRREL
ncbi:helix-turn-helix domain-containing protein [Tropicibacter sp. Alg240-R139]|uniref:helix-turn-helix domain-containing protein n=1 Tax=Tropicibacter sp. Alg240-R139 TaxID=2305991 RepID=UPI0013E0BA43|nr:helix-turn-helix domain-containing protein [Tropicibacter sp. Alg240-R139]